MSSTPWHRRVGACAASALLLLLSACDSSSGTPSPPERTENRPAASSPAARRDPAPVVRDDLESVFRQAGTRGAFALYDVRDRRWTLVNRERAEQRAVPASTFKVMNSLVALESGAVRDETEVVPYGGKPQRLDAWEHNMNLRDAIRASNLPVYQEVARRIGRHTMEKWLDRVGYGNRHIGPDVDQFWLDGSLKISPVEQVRFLHRLSGRHLPASADSQRTVRDILPVEGHGDRTVRAKTGWARLPDTDQGWWVGWAEHDGRRYCFALVMDVERPELADKRIALGHELLRRLGVRLPEPAATKA
ncbi:class D beta-lactamase [Streptomyces daliensis]